MPAVGRVQNQVTILRRDAASERVGGVGSGVEQRQPPQKPSSSFTPTIAAAHAQLQRRAQNVEVLRSRIGQDDFYQHMARLDPLNAAQWRQMVQVQATFKRAERGYDAETRTYSESMRDSLHRMTIMLYQQRGPGQIYDDFVRAHPALFKENGACDLKPGNQFAVAWNAHPSMRTLGNLDRLYQGADHDQDYLPLVRAAADETRAARRAQKLPVTHSGYSR